MTSNACLACPDVSPAAGGYQATSGVWHSRQRQAAQAKFRCVTPGEHSTVLTTGFVSPAGPQCKSVGETKASGFTRTYCRLLAQASTRYRGLRKDGDPAKHSEKGGEAAQPGRGPGCVWAVGRVGEGCPERRAGLRTQASRS